MPDVPPFIDGHLDLAMNALLYERDQTLPLTDIRGRESEMNADEPGIATVTLPELQAANVRLVMATIIARTRPWVGPERRPTRYNIDWPAPAMTEAMAFAQLSYYLRLQQSDAIRMIGSAADLDTLWQGPTGPLGMVLLMEGADPIVHPDDLSGWVDMGLRVLGLAHYGQARYACGTPNPDDPRAPDGPLTDLGRSLLDEMVKHNLLLDLSHLSDRSHDEAAERYAGPICASHSACRAIADNPRQITDAQIKRIASRGGVVGLPLYNPMLKGDGVSNRPSRGDVSLSKVIDHIDHVCHCAGSDAHVAIGSDLDGGFGRDGIPQEMDSAADLQKLPQALSGRGYSDDAISRICHGNWYALLNQTLAFFDQPQATQAT